MEEEDLKAIAEYFIGDIEGSIYEYKTGPKLIQFFNKYFGYNDIYPSRNSIEGFPSRWIFVYNKLVELINKKKFGEFILLITNQEYIFKEKGNENLVENQKKALSYFNLILRKKNLELIYHKNNGEIININNDLTKIGTGGFCDVYYSGSKKIAIKRLRKENYQNKIMHRFKREYEIMSNLSNINGILPVYNYNVNEYEYTMKYVPNTLMNYIRENELSNEMKKKYIFDLANTLIEVEKHCVHRDLNPNNILVDKDNKLYISDFGLGKSKIYEHSHKTQRSTALGTFEYCAPEQFNLLKDANTIAVDIYSFGKVVNYIMTGDSSSYDHIYKPISARATNENPQNRFNSFMEIKNKIIEINNVSENKSNMKIIGAKLNIGNYDDECDIYINGLNEVEYRSFILNSNIDVIIKHVVYDKSNLNKFIVLCKENDTFTDCDKLTDIINELLDDINCDYSSKILLCESLSKYANQLNRFYTQKKMSEIRRKDRIDPTLIEELDFSFEE